MISRVLITVVGLIVISELAQSRIISFYDIQPAKLIQSDSQPKAAGVPIFKDCSKTTDNFKVTSVTVEGCTTPPCILKKGGNATVGIDFVASEITPNMTAKVYGQIAGVDIPFPLTNENACTCGVTCPTKVATAYKYKYSLPISTVYPSVECVVYWYLYDSSKAEALCITVLVQIE